MAHMAAQLPCTHRVSHALSKRVNPANCHSTMTLVGTTNGKLCTWLNMGWSDDLQTFLRQMFPPKLPQETPPATSYDDKPWLPTYEGEDPPF
jgi:hypothetical protein